MMKGKRRKASEKTLLLLTVILVILLGISGCGKQKEQEAAEDNEAQQTQVETQAQQETETEAAASVDYTFRYDDLLESHYEKHGIEMGFDSPEDYLAAANAVIANPDALTKTEWEDGDLIYYVEETNEFVVLSTDGYIRTYFLPDSGKRYFDKQ